MKMAVELILKVSLSAGILTLVLFGVRFLLQKARAPKWGIVLVWGLLAVRLLVPFTIPLKSSPVPDLSKVTGMLAIPENTGIVVDHSDRSLYEVPGESLPKDGEAGQPAGSVTSEPAKDSESAAAATPGAEAMPSSASHQPKLDFYAIFLIVYAVGVTVMLLYFVLSLLKLKRKVRASITLPNAPDVRFSDHIDTAFVLGVFRPVIYLPSDLPERFQKDVIRHERSHMERKDPLWKTLGFLLLALHWFNPLVWLAYRTFERDIEYACDEKTVRPMTVEERQGYAEALLSMGSARKVIAACPVEFAENGIRPRVEALFRKKKPILAVTILAMILAVAVSACLFTSKETAPETDSPVESSIETKAAAAVKTGYYIAKSPEDEAFVMLSIDDRIWSCNRAKGEINGQSGIFEIEGDRLYLESIDGVKLAEFGILSETELCALSVDWKWTDLASWIRPGEIYLLEADLDEPLIAPTVENTIPKEALFKDPKDVPFPEVRALQDLPVRNAEGTYYVMDQNEFTREIQVEGFILSYYVGETDEAYCFLAKKDDLYDYNYAVFLEKTGFQPIKEMRLPKRTYLKGFYGDYLVASIRRESPLGTVPHMYDLVLISGSGRDIAVQNLFEFSEDEVFIYGIIGSRIFYSRTDQNYAVADLMAEDAFDPAAIVEIQEESALMCYDLASGVTEIIQTGPVCSTIDAAINRANPEQRKAIKEEIIRSGRKCISIGFEMIQPIVDDPRGFYYVAGQSYRDTAAELDAAVEGQEIRETDVYLTLCYYSFEDQTSHSVLTTNYHYSFDYSEMRSVEPEDPYWIEVYGDMERVFLTCKSPQALLVYEIGTGDLKTILKEPEGESEGDMNIYYGSSTMLQSVQRLSKDLYVVRTNTDLYYYDAAEGTFTAYAISTDDPYASVKFVSFSVLRAKEKLAARPIGGLRLYDFNEAKPVE